MRAQALARILQGVDGPPPVLLDVRDPTQFAICALPGARNLALPRLRRTLEKRQRREEDEEENGDELVRLVPKDMPGAF